MLMPTDVSFSEAVRLAKEEIKAGNILRYMTERDGSYGLTIEVLTLENQWRPWWAEFEEVYYYIPN